MKEKDKPNIGLSQMEKNIGLCIKVIMKNGVKEERITKTENLCIVVMS